MTSTEPSPPVSVSPPDFDASSGERPGFVERGIVRHKAGVATEGEDNVAEEVPVALVYNDISHAVMMATPRDLEAFAIGFSLTEGIVDSASEIYEVEVVEGCDSFEVQMRISQRAFMAMKEHRRAMAGRTGCGVCGIESIELLDLQPVPIAAPRAVLEPTRDMIERAAAELPAWQTLMRATGGVHAAAWCGADGSVRYVFEDVGRHNGLDKLIGHLASARVPLDDGFVFLSSRASYELVRKAARMNIQLVATISAPTSLAIRIAEMAGVRLLSFCRKDGYVEYTRAPGGR
ncbi:MULTISPECIES: formate dehydrogenase accessory sulfurtransferase FdhD [Cupriavidus]|uniref:Sulfur carrier protein FdhD n=1 Tax=Cupriavidus pauculus TaxID=82633 RepID=A0A5P2H234_9BURK|nr:formate dehydrogenase accessory sulfurtransferase FdhD [Cupriavidus pauculus]QET02087.1 formate dehydrogenase accessory sulfurtransferase FdhD [Cupriavidus pauculus]